MRVRPRTSRWRFRYCCEKKTEMSNASITVAHRYFLILEGCTLLLGGGEFAAGEYGDADGGENAAENHTDLSERLQKFQPGNGASAAEIIDRGETTREVERGEQEFRERHCDVVDDAGLVDATCIRIDLDDPVFFNDLLQSSGGETKNEHSDGTESCDRKGK